MAELIECRECTSPYCRGCNIYILSRALRDRKFDGLMNENRLIVVPKDVAPVRHGRWKPYDLTYGRSVYYCTACEHSAVVPTVLDEPIFNYCPNCGAKMDWEEEV